MTTHDNIDTIISAIIKCFSTKLSECFDINVKEIVKIMNDQDVLKEISDIIMESKMNNGKNPKNTKAESKKTIENAPATCPYIFTKGKKAGEQCGVKLSKDNTHCSLHRKKSVAVEEKKTVSKPKAVAKSTNNSDTEEEISDKEEEIPKPKASVAKTAAKKAKEPATNCKPKIIIRTDNEVGEFVHNETGLVFRHANGVKFVIGARDAKSSKVVQLNADHLETIKKYGFRYDEDCLIPSLRNAEAEITEPVASSSSSSKPEKPGKPILSTDLQKEFAKCHAEQKESEKIEPPKKPVAKKIPAKTSVVKKEKSESDIEIEEELPKKPTAPVKKSAEAPKKPVTVSIPAKKVAPAKQSVTKTLQNPEPQIEDDSDIVNAIHKATGITQKITKELKPAIKIQNNKADKVEEILRKIQKNPDDDDTDIDSNDTDAEQTLDEAELQESEIEDELEESEIEDDD